ncbi:MAG: class I SAM-dependent methyltransferase [Pseudomonadota bacterium]
MCDGRRAARERVLNDIELSRCRACGAVFANLSAAEIERENAEIFDEDSEHTTDYDWSQSSLDDAWFRLLATRFTRRLGPGRVLDIGCGNGQLLSHFQDLGWHGVGLDPSSWSRRCSELRGFELLHGFPEEFSGRTPPFTLVLSTSTLEHVADPQSHLRAIVGFVGPGGSAYFCGVPNYGSWAVRLNLSSFFANKPPMHVNYFTPGSLSRLVRTVTQLPFRLRTYGVPELHRLLYLRREREHDDAASEPDTLPAERRSAGSVKTLARKLAVRGYYWAGAPLRLGDKLELELRR